MAVLWKIACRMGLPTFVTIVYTFLCLSLFEGELAG